MSAALAGIDPRTLSGAVVAAGKAAWGMYDAFASSCGVTAAVIAAPGDAERVADHPGTVEFFRAGHPGPNSASVAAGERALALAQASAARGGLLVLLSGGASALLAAPASGVTLEDKVETGHALMAAGAAIHELNCVRKHLSRIKGGRLAAVAGRTVTLALSDVHGPVADDPSVIGSGPTVPDETTFSDALGVIGARGISAPRSVIAHLERGARGEVEESIKPDDSRIAESVYVVIGNRQTAVEGARLEAIQRGYHVVTLRAATAGEAREAGRAFAEEAARLALVSARPLCVIGSGETTVTVRGTGLGGRNQEFALAAAAALRPLGAAVLGSAGTDGIDGPTDAAGAVTDSTTLDRAEQIGLDPAGALAANDAYHFFESLGDLIHWGATGTNVGDIHVVLVGERGTVLGF